MSSTTFWTAPSRHARPSTSVLARVRESFAARRDAARSRRQLETVLAGHHGRTMRDELQSVLTRS
jgi:hypothetical protein